MKTNSKRISSGADLDMADKMGRKRPPLTSTLTIEEKLNPAKTLSQLASEAMELSRMLAETQGELTPEIEQRLEVNSQLLMRKVDSYVYIEDRFKAEADFFKKKADFFSKLSKTYLNQIEKLRDRIKQTMKSLEKDLIQGNEYRYSLSQSAPKLIIEDESLIPSDFKIVVQTVELDKDKIKQALINGFEVPGSHIEENGTLRIYENTGKD